MVVYLKTEVWGPSKYEFEGPHGRPEQYDVSSLTDGPSGPTSPSPAGAVSLLTEWTLVSVSPASLSEGVANFYPDSRRPRKALTPNKRGKSRLTALFHRLAADLHNLSAGFHNSFTSLSTAAASPRLTS